MSAIAGDPPLTSTDTNSTEQTVFGSLPPRESLPAAPMETEELWLHLARPESEPSMMRAMLRSMRWLLAIGAMLLSSVVDAVRGRRSDRDRGIRLRKLFERMGGTAIKVGQQMSVRIDLLPYEVCDELAKLQDRVAPFDVDVAIAAIEKTIGKPLDAIFAAFDREPIGSASIACVYRATLDSGESVAVKVRRPAIELQFRTDLRFVDWMTKSAEMMALVKPDFFKHLRQELRDMLLEELDFEREARYQRLFRRSTRKSRLKWLSAPKIFSDYCGPEVLVSEFVDGVWCRELLAAVSSDDRDALATIERMNIDICKTARRLLYVQFWGTYESLFFHADPHPSNILITEGGRILFLDFGACGTTSTTIRRYQQALLDSLVEDDVTGMVEAAMHLLAPLPPVDVREFKRRIEAAYHRQVQAVRDPDAEWWERTTMGLWLAMVQVTQEFKIPINLDVIRQFRASLLYDTLAFRLDPDLDLPRLYRRYRRDTTRRMARRIRRQQRKVWPRDARSQMIVRAVEGAVAMRNAVDEGQSLMSEVPVRLEAAIGKGAYFAKVLLDFVLASAGTIGVIAIALYARDLFGGSPARFVRDILKQPAFLIVPALYGIKALRHLFFRLKERDEQAGRGSLWR
ncbi:MAG TPA: AarF/UbiB family protein [Thermoanaerobaculia bacterium]|nr:AarF/UbiB family protein [Thermoanaerobaculia bacterium]